MNIKKASLPFDGSDNAINPSIFSDRKKLILATLVIFFMFLSSCLMALAWLGHLRFRDEISFWLALGCSWLIVLPEYVLNVAATRFGYSVFNGAQMASFHLAFGVVNVALVSHYVLNESFTVTQIVGFSVLSIAMILITYRP